MMTQWLLRLFLSGHRHLPTVLTQEEVQAMLKVPDTSKKMGIRDRAILEVMYATGMC